MKLQIFISQRTDFHFAKYRFHFVSFRFAKYNKPENSMRLRAVVRDPFLRENAWRYQYPVTCSFFGGKLVRTAKSRQEAFMPPFGLLELTKRSSAFNDFPQFSWSDLTDKEVIGKVWFCLVWFRFMWFRFIWFRLVGFVLVGFVLLVSFWLVSFYLVSFRLVSFCLVSFWLVSFWLVSFRLANYSNPY